MAPPPLALAVVAALVQHALARGRRPTPVSVAAAFAVASGSAWLALDSLWRFHRAGTSVNPLDTGHANALVASGSLALTRNPMYLAMAGALASHALFRASLAAICPMVAFGVVMDRVQISREEAALRARFGTGFDDYAAAVPRWLGPVRPRGS